MAKSIKNLLDKKAEADKLQEGGLLFLTAFAGGLSAYFYGLPSYEIVKLLLLVTISAGCMVYAIEVSRMRNGYLSVFLWKFIFFYGVSLCGSVLFVLLPLGLWPYMAVFTGLMLFSNRLIGMCAGSTLLLISVLLRGLETPDLFLIYFVCGTTGILLFSGIDYTLSAKQPVLIALLVQMVCLCLHDVLLSGTGFHFSLLLAAFINTVITFLLLMALLKLCSRTRDAYGEMNDLESSLLVALKAVSEEEYYTSIHTAYFCNKIARKLSIDVSAAEAGGYYYKIGSLKGKESFENTRELLSEYHVPDKALRILWEYLEEGEEIVSKEAAVLAIADTVVSSISYLFSKNPEMQPDYDTLIPALMRNKLESGVLNHCKLSLWELDKIKEVLLEERAYYDFLRRK